MNSDFSSLQSVRDGELGHQMELRKMRVMNNYVWYFCITLLAECFSVLAGFLKRTNDRLVSYMGFICLLT